MTPIQVYSVQVCSLPGWPLRLCLVSFFTLFFILSCSCASESPERRRGLDSGPAPSDTPNLDGDGDIAPIDAPKMLCQDSDDSGCIRIASFNIECFNASGLQCFSDDPISISVDERRRRVADLINNNGLDLLGLQEIEDDGILGQLIDQLEGGSSAWDYEIGDSGGDLRVAILYRRDIFTLSNLRELDSDNTGSLIGGAHWARLRHPLAAQVTVTATGEQFDLVVLHLKASSDQGSCETREDQAEDLNDWLEVQDSSVIMIGDYNDTLGSGGGICPQPDTLESLETNPNFVFATDSSAGLFDPANYTNLGFKSVIDHILVPRLLLPRLSSLDGYYADVISHDNESISDHQPVYIWLYTTGQ